MVRVIKYTMGVKQSDVVSNDRGVIFNDGGSGKRYSYAVHDLRALYHGF